MLLRARASVAGTRPPSDESFALETGSSRPGGANQSVLIARNPRLASRQASPRALEPRSGARMPVAGRAPCRRGVAQETRASGGRLGARWCPGPIAPGSLEVLEDLLDDGRLGDERDDSHLSSARAQQGVRFIDAADELGPLPPQSPSLGPRHFLWPLRLNLSPLRRSLPRKKHKYKPQRIPNPMS